VDVRILSRGVGREPRIGPAGDVALGLRNIIQNAVDFADAEVIIEASWTAERIEVTISDDGDGFDGDILDGTRPGPGRPRARGGPGTGSGVALARALLASGGGAMELGNAAPKGARVRVTWARTAEHG
jgi:two-component system sensor histidine kinase RegB